MLEKVNEASSLDCQQELQKFIKLNLTYIEKWKEVMTSKTILKSMILKLKVKLLIYYYVVFSFRLSIFIYLFIQF